MSYFGNFTSLCIFESTGCLPFVSIGLPFSCTLCTLVHNNVNVVCNFILGDNPQCVVFTTTSVKKKEIAFSCGYHLLP